MIRIIAPLAALFLGVALLLTGLGLQGTLLPVRATLEDFSALEIGLLGSAYFVGFVAGCIRTSYLVQAVGHIRVFAALVVLISAVPLLHALAVGPVIWLALRAVTGFCMAGVYLVIESWLNSHSTNEMRGTILALYTSISLGAITVGQLLLPLYDPTRFELFVLASVLVSFAAVPVALTRTPGPAPLTQVSFRLMRLVTISPVGIAGCVGIGLVTGAVWSVAPAYVLGVGLSVSDVAIFMSVTVLGGAVGQWPFGYLSDRIDRRRVIILAGLLAGLAGVALFLASEYWRAGILVCAFVFGVAAFPIYAVSVSYVNDLIDPEDFVETSSGLLLVHGLASALGPILASAAMQALGPASMFLFTAVVLLAMTAYIAYRLHISTRPVVEQTASYVPMAGNVAMVTTMDPRVEEAEPSENEPVEAVEESEPPEAASTEQ